jgi:hypothetical protein
MILSGARFTVAAGVACVASAIFYAATCLALYFVLVGISAVTNKDPGGPLAGILWPFVLFFVGLAMALVVYTPLTLLTFALARHRMWVWLVAPLFVATISFTLDRVRLAISIQRSSRPVERSSGPCARAALLLHRGLLPVLARRVRAVPTRAVGTRKAAERLIDRISAHPIAELAPPIRVGSASGAADDVDVVGSIPVKRKAIQCDHGRP